MTKPNKFIYLLLPIILITVFMIAKTSSNQGKGSKSSKPIIQIQLPIQIENIQYYRDGGTIGLHIKDGEDRNILFSLDGRLSSKTPQTLYLGAMHPDTENATQIPKGSHAEKGIIKALRSWLKIKITNTKNQKTNNTLDETEKFRIFQIVNIVTILQKNFKNDPDLFEPAYNCHDLHGGYNCWMESNK